MNTRLKERVVHLILALFQLVEALLCILTLTLYRPKWSWKILFSEWVTRWTTPNRRSA